MSTSVKETVEYLMNTEGADVKLGKRVVRGPIVHDEIVRSVTEGSRERALKAARTWHPNAPEDQRVHLTTDFGHIWYGEKDYKYFRRFMVDGYLMGLEQNLIEVWQVAVNQSHHIAKLEAEVKRLKQGQDDE